MADGITFRMEGFRELEAALRELPHTTSRASARRVLKKAGQPVADAANGSAPVRFGNLSQSYAVSPKLNRRQRGLHRRQDPVEMFIGTNDPAGVQTEFGNERQSAQPHFRPAWEGNRVAVLESIGSLLWADIEKTVARMRRAGKL